MNASCITRSNRNKDLKQQPAKTTKDNFSENWEVVSSPRVDELKLLDIITMEKVF